MKTYQIILLAIVLASCRQTNHEKLSGRAFSDSVNNSPNDTSVTRVKATVSKKDTTGNGTLKKIFHVDTIIWTVSPSQPYFYHGKQASLMAETIGKDTSTNTEGSYRNISYRGYVCLTEMDFTGNEIPFICSVSDNIKSLYVDNKKIKIKSTEEFFFRQHVDLYGGYNRIPVKITNKRNETTDTYIEIRMVTTN